MTMRIGPIELENPQIQTPNRQKVSDYFKPIVNKDNVVYTPVGQVPTSYSVKLAVPTHVYKQIEGISEWTAPYPIVLDELSQDMLGISGWGFIGNVKVEDNQNPEIVIMSCDVAIIEPDENAFLKMDYTNGTESNTVINMTYDDYVNESIFDEHFASLDTQVRWENPLASTYYSGTMNVASVNGTYVLKPTGNSTYPNKSASIFTTTQDSVDIPFVMEFDMGWNRYATKYANQMIVGLFTEKPTDMSGFWNNDGVFAYLWTTPTYCNLHFSKRIDGNSTQVASWDTMSSSTEKDPKIKFVVDNSGRIAIYKDTTGAKDSFGDYIWTEVWSAHDPGWDIKEGLYIAVGFNNYSGTSEYVTCGEINVYQTIKTTPRNVVPYPIGCTIVDDSEATFTRTTEEGTMSMCTNPSDYMVFQTSYDNWDLGAVKVFNNNNEASTYRRVFNDENVFTPTSWYATNGMTKIFADQYDNIFLQYYDSPANTWQTIEVFYIGDILYVKPFYISPEYCIIQINNTYWWLFRGKRHIMINHSDKDIRYSKKTLYSHDIENLSGVTYFPADSSSISMVDDFYCNVYNGYNLLSPYQSDVDPNGGSGLSAYGVTSNTGVTGARDTSTYYNGGTTSVASFKAINNYTSAQDLYIGQTSAINYCCGVLPGNTYTYSAYCKRGIAGTGKLRINWYDVNGNYITAGISSIQNIGTGWGRLNFTTTAPPNAWYGRFMVQYINVAIGESVWYDCGMVTEGNSLLTWTVGCNDDPNANVDRFEIVQAVPTTITAGTIPKTEYTGIVWYNNSKDPDADGNGYIKLAREFFNVVDTRITK